MVQVNSGLVKSCAALSAVVLAQGEWEVKGYGVDRATAKMIVTVIAANLLGKMRPFGFLDTASKLNFAATAIQTCAVLNYLVQNNDTVHEYAQNWRINIWESRAIWLGLTALIARYGLNTKY